MSFAQLTYQIFHRFGIIIAIALLVIWAIGTLLGVNLLMTGMSILFGGAALRRLAA